MKINFFLACVIGLSVSSAARTRGDVAPEKPTVQPPRSIYDKAFDETFRKATDGWLEDPLLHIETDMSHCVDGLAALQTDKPLQTRQARVVNRLDAVIKLLEAECKGGGGSNPNPSKPMSQSIIAKGPGGQGDMHDPKAGDKQWASLPPKQREQILQSQTQGFPPGFETILQSYYARLAQEQVEAGNSAPPAEGEK